MRNRAVIQICINNERIVDDLDVPLEISINDFIKALNSIYRLGLSDEEERYLKSENPIRFMKGEKTLLDFGVRDGTIIFLTIEETNNK